MESFPLAGIPHQFNHWGEFEHYCETLGRAGAILFNKRFYIGLFGLIWNMEQSNFRICDALSTPK